MNIKGVSYTSVYLRKKNIRLGEEGEKGGKLL